MATPTLIQYQNSAVNISAVYGAGTPQACNPFLFNLPNAAIAGNCLVLFVACPYLSGRTCVVTDNNGGNTWTAALATPQNDGTNMVFAFVALNVAAGTQAITVTFDTYLYNCNFKCYEWDNIATTSAIGVTTQANTSGTTVIAAGNFTPTNGDLILHYGYDSNVGANFATPITSMSQGSGFAFLSADVTMGTFAQYKISNGTLVNPTVNITGGTDSFITCAIALHTASAGGTSSQTCRIVGIHHFNINRAVSIITPLTGTCIVAMSSFPENVLTITGLADSLSNTWTECPTTACGTYTPQVWFTGGSASTSSTQTMTFTGPTETGTDNNSNQFSVLIYDCVGVASQGANNLSYAQITTNQATGNFNLGVITPSNPNGIVLAVQGTENGVITAATGSGQILDVFYGGAAQSDPDLMDNSDGYAHTYPSTTAQITWGWTLAKSSSPEFQLNLSLQPTGLTGSYIVQGPLYGTAAGSTTVTANFVVNTTTGNTLVALVSGYDGATVRTISSVKLNGSTSLTNIVTQAGSASAYGVTGGFAIANITGGSSQSITATFSGSTTEATIVIYELAGMPTSLTTDGSSGVAGTASTSTSSPNITTTNANDVIFTYFTPHTGDTMTSGESGWTWGTVPTSAPVGGIQSLAQCIYPGTTKTGYAGTGTQSASATYGAIIFALEGTTSAYRPDPSQSSISSSASTILYLYRPFNQP